MNKPGAYFTIQCWGCNKCVTRSYTDHVDIENQIERLKIGGWQRREFGPNASPWFCSEDCAYNSFNAKRAEDWWKLNNNRKNIYSRLFALALCVFVVMIMGALLGNCIHAGL